MRRYNSSLVAVGVVLFLVTLLLHPAGAAAQGDADPILQLKEQALMAGDLAMLPFLPSVQPEPIVTAQTSQGSSTEYWSQIAFQSYRDDNWEIYRMNRFGANQTRLTHNSASDFRPRLKPDLSEIVFTSNRDGNWNIYKMRIGGTHLQRLTENYDDEIHPDWSPDGRYIVYSRKKNGLWSLYRMNADGSGQQRLTTPQNAYDVYPAWSPDNSRIAWVRIHAGGIGSVMMMGSGGGDPRSIYVSAQYMQNLAWSPDSKNIAFDADWDKDGWNQLVVVNLEGSYYTKWIGSGLGPLKDKWLGGWSPDGKYLIFTVVKYIEKDGKLYISETRLKKEPRHGGEMEGYTDTGMDMAPDWEQGKDNQPPTASIQPLPNISPSPVIVHWSGADTGPSKLASYDVQVRVDYQAWKDWLSAVPETSAGYPGVGSHHYAFRVRSRDHAGNLSAWTTEDGAETTVESLPPHSEFDPPPGDYIRFNGVLSWRGEDEGGSGVKGYNVQYRRSGTDVWERWVSASTQTSAVLPNLPLGDYYFRVRAFDQAQNLGQWTETPTPSSAYRWRLWGKVIDNRERPIPGVKVIESFEPKASVLSDKQGQYNMYLLRNWRTEHPVRWEKSGYGKLPKTTYITNYDKQIAVVLPPPDNVIQDASFEITETHTSWLNAGVFPGRTSLSSQHTGVRGAQVGLQPFHAGFTHIGHEGDDLSPKIFVDAQTNRHLWWGNKDRGFFYTRIAANGQRSPVKQLDIDGATNAYLAVTQQGIVHAIWLDGFISYRYPFYAMRQANGVWKQRKLDGRGPFKAALDEGGRLHVVYKQPKSYQRRRADGVWTPLEVVPAWQGELERIITLADGSVYVFSLWQLNGDLRWGYVMRDASGHWHTWKEMFACKSLSRPIIKIDANRTIHFLAHRYGAGYDDALIYVQQYANGSWSREEIHTGQKSYIHQCDLFVGRAGLSQILCAHAEYDSLQLFYAHQMSDRTWATEKKVFYADRRYWISDNARLRFAMDKAGRLYVVGGEHDAIVVFRNTDGQWTLLNPTGALCGANATMPVSIAFDAEDTPYLAWSAGAPCDIYQTSAVSKNGGDSLLQQSVFIPEGLRKPTLSFFYRFFSPYPSASKLKVMVEDDTRTAMLFETATPTEDWEHQWVDMSPWAGKSVTVTFALPQIPGSFSAWADLDDVTLGSSAYADAWVSPLSLIPEAGDHLSLLLPYGNAGDALSSNTQLTLTLPAQLELLSAVPAPSAHPDPTTWLWHVGDLPVGSQSELALDIAIPADIRAGSVLSGALSISTTMLELEEANNAAPLWFFIHGSHLYLPTVIHSGL